MSNNCGLCMVSKVTDEIVSNMNIASEDVADYIICDLAMRMKYDKEEDEKTLVHCAMIQSVEDKRNGRINDYTQCPHDKNSEEYLRWAVKH